MPFGIQNKKEFTGTAVDRAAYDEGLRAYMLRVYNYMASGLALTGIIAVVVTQMSVNFNDAGQITGVTQIGYTLFGTPLKWVVMLAPLGMVFFLSAKLHSMKFSTAQTTFWIYAGLMGVSMATIFIAFTGESIARVFFITAGRSGVFSAVSIAVFC